MTIKEALNKLPKNIEIEIDLLIHQLNKLEKINDLENYDNSYNFRKQVIEEGYRIIRLFAVYYQGWECDEWSADCTKDGQKYKITSNHGRLVVEPREEEPRKILSQVQKQLLRAMFGNNQELVDLLCPLLSDDQIREVIQLADSMVSCTKDLAFELALPSRGDLYE